MDELPDRGLLVLGGVAMFQPVNGYQIRRELVSWQVDRWANIKPGSIYHGLGRLAEEGLLRRTDLVDAGREVADDALDYEWGYEWPTAEQWEAGQDYGRCWAPDSTGAEE